MNWLPEPNPSNSAAAGNRRFDGPVFIIGMPRSGTKLLRDLLNRHPRIGIPDVETNFLPAWVSRWDTYGDLSNADRFHDFYRQVTRLTYFHYMRETGRLIPADEWYRSCRNFTPAGVFEALVRHDAGVPRDAPGIWGDKSPAYITRIDLIRELFPSARFIHIIRDARDYCLSINRAWGKNMIRAAQRWRDDVEEARRKGASIPEIYREIRYEDLIAAPGGVLEAACRFLDIAYDPGLTRLAQPVENLGDARGFAAIKSDNAGKYHRRIPPPTLRKIESITAPVMRSCGYPVDYDGNPKRLGSLRMTYYKALDGFQLFRFDLGERGIPVALNWMVGRFFFRRRFKP